jgi:copper chaperone CopZ
MQKVEGVEKVSVSLKEGLATLNLKPANALTMAKLRDIIKNNGFVSKEAVIVAHGAPGSAGVFEVSGTEERLPMTGKPVSEGPNTWRFTSPGK